MSISNNSEMSVAKCGNHQWVLGDAKARRGTVGGEIRLPAVAITKRNNSMRRISALTMLVSAAAGVSACSPRSDAQNSKATRSLALDRALEGDSGAKTIWEETVNTSKGPVTFFKTLDPSGNIQFLARDATGQTLPGAEAEDNFLPEERSIITAALQAAIQSAADKDDDAPATILVSLAVDSMEDDAMEVLEGRPDGTVLLNGKEVSQEDLRTLAQSKNARLLEQAAAREQQRRLIVDELSRRESWDLTDDQKAQWASDWHLISLEKKLSDVERFAEANRDLILSVDLPDEGSTSTGLLNGERDTFIEDTLGHACVTTGANNDLDNERCGAHRLGNDGNGSGIGVYLTEVYCPASLPGPGGYTKLAGTCPGDFSGTWADCRHAINTTNILRAVAQQVYVSCRGAGLDSAGNYIDPPPPSFSDRSGANPPISITSESFNYTSGAYSAVDQEWDDASYSNSLLVINSAGNGAANFVGAPSHGFNVLTVGNYDDSTHAIASTSRYLDGNDNAGSNKPEISAPGQGIDAGIDPFDLSTITLNGTSMAAAFTAGFAADLQRAYSQLVFRPALSKAWIMNGAMGGQTGTSPPVGITGGFDKVGWGGIDYRYAYYKSYCKRSTDPT